MDTDERAIEFARLVAVELSNEARRRGISQARLASAAGVTAAHFSHTVHGRKGPLTLAVLSRAAEFLGIDPRVIVGRAYEGLVEVAGVAPSSSDLAVTLGGVDLEPDAPAPSKQPSRVRRR